LFILFFQYSFSQPTYFNKRLSNLSAADISTTVIKTDSGYILLGQVFDSLFYQCVSINFVDTLGNRKWHKNYGKPYHNYYIGTPNNLCKTKDGGYALGCTYKDTNGNKFITIIKFNNKLDTLWTKIIIKDTIHIGASQCKSTEDGGFILAGAIQVGHPYNFLEDVLLIKTDSLGNIEWNKTYDYGQYDRGANVVQTPDGGYLIGAYTGDVYNSASGDPLVIRTDSLGNLKWKNVYGGSLKDEVAIVGLTSDSNYIIGTAYTTKLVGIDGWIRRTHIIKIKPDETIIWDKQYSSSKGYNTTQTIKELPDKNIIVTGYYSSDPTGNYYSIILKINKDGDSLWMREKYCNLKGEYSQNYLQDIEQTKDGGFIACGYVIPTAPDTGGESMWVLKLDSLGCDTLGCQLHNVTKEVKVKSEGINIYPNPVIDKLTLQIPQTSTESTLSIFNITGEEIIKQQICRLTDKTELDVSRLTSGMYFMRIVNEKGINVVKFIKN
jgi:hypothetical protein